MAAHAHAGTFAGLNLARHDSLRHSAQRHWQWLRDLGPAAAALRCRRAVRRRTAGADPAVRLAVLLPARTQSARSGGRRTGARRGRGSEPAHALDRRPDASDSYPGRHGRRDSAGRWDRCCRRVTSPPRVWPATPACRCSLAASFRLLMGLLDREWIGFCARAGSRSNRCWRWPISSSSAASLRSTATRTSAGACSCHPSEHLRAGQSGHRPGAGRAGPARTCHVGGGALRGAGRCRRSAGSLAGTAGRRPCARIGGIPKDLSRPMRGAQLRRLPEHPQDCYKAPPRRVSRRA